MNEILEALQAMFPKLKTPQLKGIVALLGLGDAVLVGSSEEAEEDNSKKSVTISEIAERLKNLGYNPRLPGLEVETESRDSSMRVPYQKMKARPDEDDDDEDDDGEANRAKNYQKFLANVNRIGQEEDDVTAVIMKDILGNGYQAELYEQRVAFGKYIRGGEKRVSNREMKLLEKQIFPIKSIYNAVVAGGLDVRTLKATQVEAQGELGGIAVPPMHQSSVETRLPGLTAVRGSGANVITLVNSNSIEIPQWRTDDTTEQRYIGMIRGERAGETADPNEKNYKLDLVPLVAYLYTFKVVMSQSLVEDAANLITTLMNDIAITIAMDEDKEFLVGDGAGKAEGILPGGVNGNSLKEVVSGSASALTVAGIKALKRGVASQYRKNCVWIGESNTWGVVESFTAGAGTSNWAFPDLSEEEKLLRRQVYESEVMPTIGAGTYPIIFGWMQGYDIVERLGMTIMRFQDSKTGINRVEYHVRKRWGGKLEKPWMFGVQKVAAS